MSALQKAPQGFVKLSDQQKYDPGTQTEYRETKWAYQGHKLDVNIDEYGVHARADNGDARVNMDEHGFVAWVMRLFGG